ncbi:MAG: N-acetyl-gamma-glutamyl-phosphate reductase [Cyanobacteria bacterium P01_D01_bin.44]
MAASPSHGNPSVSRQATGAQATGKQTTGPLPVGIVGLPNQTTRYLVQLLSGHPRVTLTHLSLPTHRPSPQTPPQLSPQWEALLQTLGLPDPALTATASPDLTQCAAIFLNLPPGEAAEWVPALIIPEDFDSSGSQRIFDLSPDYRFSDLSLYQRCYQIERRDTAVAINTVYGLPELFSDRIRPAQLIGCPESAPTASLLASAPLLKRGLIAPDSILIDAKQGSEGTVLTPLNPLNYAATAEIEHIANDLIGSEILVQFTPHEIPTPCGLTLTLYANLRDPGLVSEDLVTIYRTFYRDAPWIKVLPVGQLPTAQPTLGTNHCHLGLAVDTRTQRTIVVATLDPYLKGQVGQAIQCLNLTQNWDERMGLPQFGYQ